VKTVLAQKYQDFELIIVDDGSTDNTGDIVSDIILNYPAQRIRYIQQENGERGAARNRGLRAAKGSYVTFFDSDDLLYPNHLSTAHEFATNNTAAQFIHLRYDIRNENSKITGVAPEFHNSPGKKLIVGNFLSCNGVILKKELALANPFNEDRELSGLEDWELWLRLSVQVPLYWVNVITSSIYNHTERSVVLTDPKKLITRGEKLIYYVTSKEEICSFYNKKDIRKFKSSCYSYIALHIALTRRFKTLALKYLLKSISFNSKSILSRRFVATIKYLCF
jgi:glycosyltransferase involved in cell wall biosynthesis